MVDVLTLVRRRRISSLSILRVVLLSQRSFGLMMGEFFPFDGLLLMAFTDEKNRKFDMGIDGVWARRGGGPNALL